jgi:hypothetical protein
MPGPWGPPSMMYSPCPPWAGWYGLWAPPPMHFYPEWSGPTQGFGHGGYYAEDGHYRYVGHQQDRRASGRENWTVQNAKLDHPVSQEPTLAPGHQHEQEAWKDGSSADQSGSSQEKTGSRSESLADGEAKSVTKESPGEVAVEQNRVLEAKAETRTEAGTSSRRPPNWTVRFPKLYHSVSSGSGQRGTSMTTTSGMAPTPHWCPPILTSS